MRRVFRGQSVEEGAAMRELQRSTAFRKWASTSSSVGCLFAMVLLWGVLADENTTVGRKELAAGKTVRTQTFAVSFTAALQSSILHRCDEDVHTCVATQVNKEVTERIIGQTCSKDDISVYQGATTPLPNGIPTFTVQILNMCISGGCNIADIHLSCGWFSSARTINPRVFRRLGYDDCLVNDGAPLGPGSSLSFQYANSYQYPLSVAFVRCY
ncbi:hypothetical protein ACLOJK_035680 [Asimina triloba]